jgi:hypothetical protein
MQAEDLEFGTTEDDSRLTLQSPGQKVEHGSTKNRVEVEARDAHDPTQRCDERKDFSGLSSAGFTEKIDEPLLVRQ